MFGKLHMKIDYENEVDKQQANTPKELHLRYALICKSMIPTPHVFNSKTNYHRKFRTNNLNIYNFEA